MYLCSDSQVLANSSNSFKNPSKENYLDAQKAKSIIYTKVFFLFKKSINSLVI